MSTENHKSRGWGHHNLQHRKEEFHRCIMAFFKDQMPKASAEKQAEAAGCSMGVIYNMRRGHLHMVSLDMMYMMAMELDLGPNVNIPLYGSYMG